MSTYSLTTLAAAGTGVAGTPATDFIYRPSGSAQGLGTASPAALGHTIRPTLVASTGQGTAGVTPTRSAEAWQAVESATGEGIAGDVRLTHVLPLTTLAASGGGAAAAVSLSNLGSTTYLVASPATGDGVAGTIPARAFSSPYSSVTGRGTAAAAMLDRIVYAVPSGGEGTGSAAHLSAGRPVLNALPAAGAGVAAAAALRIHGPIVIPGILVGHIIEGGILA